MRKEYHSEISLSSFQVSSKEEALRRTMSGEFYKRTFSRKVTMKELVEKLANGFIVIPSEFDGEGFKKNNWVSSDYIFIDVDDAHDIDFNTLPESLKPSFIYTTLSHTEQSGRYRMGYYLSETQDDVETYESLIRGLLKVLKEKGITGDFQCSNANRIYFPAKEILFVDYERVLDVNLIEAVDPRVVNIKTTGYLTDNPIAEAVANKDVKALRSLVNVNIPSNFNNMELIEKLNSIKISEFFNLPVGSNFSCLFHEDNNPSASILNGENNEMYHCFSCGKKHNLLTLVGDLMDSTNSQAIKLLENVLRVKFTSQYQDDMLRATFFHTRELDTLEDTHEFLFKKMKRSLLPFYRAFIDIGMKRCSNTPIINDNQLTFFISQRELSKVLRTYGIRNVSDRGELGKKIDNLARIGLIVKEDKDIKPEFKKRADEYRKSQNYRYRTQFYSIPMDSDIFNIAEKNFKEQKDGGLLNSYINSKSVMLYDIDLAKKTYVQNDIDKLEKIVLPERVLILNVIEEVVEENGFAHENMLFDKLREMGYGVKWSRNLIKNHRSDCQRYFDWVYVNKEAKEERSIPDEAKYRSYIYLKK